MRRKWKAPLLICVCLLAIVPLMASIDARVAAKPQQSVTADDLLALVNGLRTGNGLSALTVNSTLMSTAQSTAQRMADEGLSLHIGATSDRVKAAGYGGSAIVWATENFAMGDDLSIDFIQTIWADEWHMIPMKNPIYCDVGAGVATTDDGTTYYVVHAAYTSRRYCGEYIGPYGKTLPTIQAETQQAGGNTPEAVPTEIASNWMEPVLTVTPNSNGELVHEVRYGHTLWTIATNYGTTVDLIKEMNGLYTDSVYVGQRLWIPTPAYFALTPSATLTPTGTKVDPMMMATQSTKDPKHTQTPTPTRTLPPKDAVEGQNNADNDDDAPTDTAQDAKSVDTMILVVFLVAAFVIVISFWQPWKSPPLPEEEDPLNTRVE